MQPQLIAGRYQVMRAIGRGGMGTVWLCRDEILGREVAIKQIGALPGESMMETKRAMREARSAAALNHPNAVAVYDVVDHDGRPWLVMEYVEGQTLADEILHEGKLPPQRVADIGAQLAGALARAHERRIVHRDIKPGNVLIDRAGRPKISDFGIARGHGDEQLTQIGFITGTPGYLSPELARGADPAPTSDVWALGATLYAAVEGQPPYESRSNPIAMLRMIATERPRPMVHAGSLAPAIEAMMHEDPARRWDMATSARRLGGIARITTVIPRPDPAPTAVMPAAPLDSTQPLQPTRRLAAGSSPQAERSSGPTLRGASPDAKPPVATPPVATPPVATPPVATPPVGTPPASVPANGQSSQGQSTNGTEDAEAFFGVQSPSREGGRRLLPLLLVAVAVLLAVLGTAYLLIQPDAQPGSTASKTTESSPANTPQAAQEPTASIAAPQPTVAPAPQPTAAPSAAAPVAPAPTSRKAVDSFVRSYYADVTQDPALTWGQLTPAMHNAAGGRSGYEGFWRTIDRVRINRTQVNASGTEVTVNLTYISGRGATTETHQFSVVNRSGRYLIDNERRVG